MKGCENWKEYLTEVALGLPVPPDVEEHLASCAVCREALTALRERSRQMDSVLRSLVCTEGPSPAFRDRLTSAIEARRASRFGWRVPIGAIAAGVAVAVLVIILGRAVNRRSGPEDSPAPPPAAARISEWRSPTDALLRTAADEFLKLSPRFGVAYFPIESRRPRPRSRGLEPEDQRRNP
jgi:hypothetical protein